METINTMATLNTIHLVKIEYDGDYKVYEQYAYYEDNDYDECNVHCGFCENCEDYAYEQHHEGYDYYEYDEDYEYYGYYEHDKYHEHQKCCTDFKFMDTVKMVNTMTLMRSKGTQRCHHSRST